MSGLLEAAIYTELAIVCGIVLDLLIGDPEQLCSVHPVVLMGKCISFLEKKLRKAFPATDKGELTAGALMAVMMVIGTLASTILVSYIAFRIHIVLFFIVQTIMCWQAVAIRDLKKESMDVYDCLEPELDIEKARVQVSRIVGRDTQELTAVGVTKAVVETIAENFSDGIVCPLFYMMIGGGPLALTYKAVNTMDSMVGYKNDRYMFFGRTGAHMDDVCGFIPSRIAAFFWIAAAAFTGNDWKGAFRIWKRDRFKSPSPNSAQTESACAGSLDVELLGPAYYFGKLHDKKPIGDPIRPIVPGDIKKTIEMMYTASMLTAGVGLLIRLLVMLAGILG